MSELRLNRITGDWVIIASERASRPEDFARKKEKTSLAAHSGECPFCPGNEAMSNAVLTHGANGLWKVRIVENKFPALKPQGEKDFITAGLKRWMVGFGYHEVVIETPRHNQWLWDQPAGDVAGVLESMKRRYRSIIEDPRVELVVLFKNHGPTAGTSLEHPHCQIVATPVMPNDVRRRVLDAIRYFDDTSKCLFCSTLDDELNDGWRIIHQSPYFVSLIPFAALSPFHTFIFPRAHRADFAQSSDTEIADLGEHLRLILWKIHNGLEDPDFNFVLRTLPAKSADPRCFHWYISIIPRVTQTAGFEMGSGMFINTAIPEQSAAFLRAVGAHSPNP